MENSLTVNLTPLHLILSLVLPIWMIVFPIILIRKVNYLIAIIQDQFDPDQETS